MGYNYAVDTTALQQTLDEIFDKALVYHGYTDYLRDYELIVYLTADPRTGTMPVYRRYLFRYCVEARCRSTVRPDDWKVSLDDRRIRHDTGSDLDGFVWGVKWHALSPGATVVTDSAAATLWSGAIGIPFHEIRIGTNAHEITLVCSELAVSVLPPGYAPFRLPDS